MDLRIVKTKRSIRSAFLRLLEQKPLEQITVTELARQAEINKGTFYLHYRDIYQLADQLQTKVLQEILQEIPHTDEILLHPSQLTATLFSSFHWHQKEIDLLFSGSQTAVLPIKIEQQLKSFLHQRFPQAKDDVKFHVYLSYSIQGGYYAYLENHKEFGFEQVVKAIGEIAPCFAPIWSAPENQTT